MIAADEKKIEHNYVKELIDSNKKFSEGTEELNFVYDFELKQDYLEKFELCRKFPFGISNDFEEKSNFLEKKEIIAKI